MLGVDSNVLVRFLTRDDEQQYATAVRLLAHAPERSIFLSVVVLVEVNWVLQRVFKRSRSEVFGTLDRLLDSRVFTVEDRPRVLRALNLARSTKADFPDALIAVGNEANGCDRTATFDVDALDLPQMISAEAAASD